MTLLRRLVCSACLLVLASISIAAGPAAAAGRVALIIGNSAYRSVPQLPNPAHDAADVAASLGRLGFSVDLVKDASFDDMRRALIGFGARARDADFAVVYFAGHGFELAGENWAVPVDAALAADRDVENEAIGLKALTLAVSGARSLGLVILDACRNNPFDNRMQHATRSRSVSRGLAPIEPTGNVLVAFAAKDGTTAIDGDGRNSPFTAALLNHLETPGLEIDFLLRNVRDDVLAATNGQQQPFAYGSLSREAVYLQPAQAPPVDGSAVQAPTADDIAWPFLATTTDPNLIRRFTAQFPASRHRAEADQLLAVLEAAPVMPPPLIHATPAPPSQDATQVSRVAPALATPEQHAVAQRFSASSPQVETAWSLVKASGDPIVLKRFTAEFPSRERKTVAAALNGIGGSVGVLRQLRAEEMHAVLSDYGRFIQHQRYGEIWVPTVVPAGWHPYEPCHWVKTPDFDWFYLDRTAWGAIVHHFGRWAHDDQLGWIWVPGVDFSPGWVLWRATSQQIGWAPMPPTEDVQTITPAQVDTADVWTFMERTDFTQGCGDGVPAALLLKSATFIRELKTVRGLPVFVLPFALPDQSVDIAFDPWPPWLVTQAIVDANQLWSLSSATCPPAPAMPVSVKGSQQPRILPTVHPADPLVQAKPPQRAAKKMPPPAADFAPRRVNLERQGRTVYPHIQSYRPRAAIPFFYPDSEPGNVDLNWSGSPLPFGGASNSSRSSRANGGAGAAGASSSSGTSGNGGTGGSSGNGGSGGTGGRGGSGGRT